MEGVCNPALDVGDVIRVRRKRLGIFQPDQVITDLAADFPNGSDLSPGTIVPQVIDAEDYADPQPPTNTGEYIISELKVDPLLLPLKKGQTVILYTNVTTNSVTVTEHCPQGATVIPVKPFHPKIQYRKGTMILDPLLVPNAGAVPYYIDQITIPLDLDSPVQITARERRIGTKEDAARISEYTIGY